MIELLKQLIATPSISRDEAGTAKLIYDRLESHGAAPRRQGNNVYALSEGFDTSRPTLLLNSHHDTVKPAASYTLDPFTPLERDGRIYGLGSNDAGASAVALMQTFIDMRRESLPFNLLLAITCEEEVGGENGMRTFLPHLADKGIDINCAIVGEPTGMQPAVAERGLVVLDCVTQGVTGHAARGEGINAIYRAMTDIDSLRNFKFERCSEILGPIGINITQINAGRQHNVVPDECSWVTDIRTTDAYSNEETVELLRKAVAYTTLTPRSTRVHASVIARTHPLVRSALAMGLTTFVSPTTSDMSLMHGIASLKIGPGDSARSHRADEYIEIDELLAAPAIYRRLIEGIKSL